MPRALDLPEDELLPLIRAAIREGVFSEAFTESLRNLVAELQGSEPEVPRELTDLDRVQAHSHGLIRSRAGDLLRERANGIWLGVGLAMLWLVPSIEHQAVLFRALWLPR